MTDEELRKVYESAVAGRRDVRRVECPSPDALLAAARREGPEQARVETLDHVMSCPDCRQDFELLRSIERGQRVEAGEAAARLRMRRPFGAALVTGLAAALAFAAVLGPRYDWWRNGTAGDVVRSAPADVDVLSPAADAAVKRGPLTFAWRAVPGARSYTLELLSPDGRTVASRQTKDTTATLAEPPLAAGEYRWWIRAQLDGGERRSASRRLRVGD